MIKLALSEREARLVEAGLAMLFQWVAFGGPEEEPSTIDLSRALDTSLADMYVHYLSFRGHGEVQLDELNQLVGRIEALIRKEGR